MRGRLQSLAIKQRLHTICIMPQQISRMLTKDIWINNDCSIPVGASSCFPAVMKNAILHAAVSARNFFSHNFGASRYEMGN